MHAAFKFIMRQLNLLILLWQIFEYSKTPIMRPPFGPAYSGLINGIILLFRRYIKSKDNYEIIDPSEVGAGKSKIILTARSGRAALAYKARQLGFDLKGEALNDAYSAFISMADSLKRFREEDLFNLLSTTTKV